MKTAASTFVIDSWDEQLISDEDGVRLARATIAKTYSGDVQGTSVTELVMATTPVETSRAYVAIERVTGSVGAAAGSFVLHHTAIASADVQAIAWTILPDSGTGELAGIRGSGTIDVDAAGAHSLTLQYELSATARVTP